ncbi:MAG: zinc-dependent metalloprotease [Gemmatimonadales bacterium]
MPSRPRRLAAPSLILALLLGCTVRIIEEQPRTTAAPAQGAGQTAKADSARKDVPWKPFAELTRDARKVDGMFTAWIKRDNVYLALKPEQFDRDYLLVTQLAQGLGDLGLDGGTSLRSDLVRFHRRGDKVELVLPNPYVTAPANSPAARTVAYSFGDPVAQVFSIASIRDTTNEVLIDIAPFLVSDWADIAGFFDFLSQVLGPGYGGSLDRERSAFLDLRGYPTNMEMDARITIHAGPRLPVEAVPDRRWLPLGIHYSWLELPGTPMRPRFADDRVGYFISARKDFSRDTASTFFLRYINRWRLEKKDPAARLSDPAKPITYYLDRTIPLEWRPYVRAGILEWNKAFEDAGIRNAIQVLDAPDDSTWSAEDARYSTVRWMANTGGTYAIGPSDVDPRTGEILNADILFAASWIQAWQGEYREYAGPEAMVRSVFLEDSLLRADPAGRFQRLCSYGQGIAQRAMFLRTALVARGIIPPGAPVPKEFIGQALKEVVMHELGHTLGLRHNFRATSAIPNDRLADTAYTATHGTAASVMDYNPPAVSLDRRRQGDYYSKTIGLYDRWAIRYGYATVGGDSPDAERPALAKIAAEGTGAEVPYGTDEDASFGRFGLDPLTTRYDQGADPLAWARDHVTLVNRLFDSLETRLVAPGESYDRLRGGFIGLLNERWYATLVATKFLAGAYTSRSHRGDPGGKAPFTPLPAATQREALRLIATDGLGEGTYRFSPRLLDRLAPSRWFHWGANPFNEPIDFPLHDWANVFQTSLLSLLLDPGVLARIRDNDLHLEPGQTAVTIPELFQTLTSVVWSEAGYGGPREARNTSSVRRDLQRSYLSMMIRMVVTPGFGTPEDARAVARLTLQDLAGSLDRALQTRGAQLNTYTRAHFADAREQIRRALEAQVVTPANLVR